MELEEELRKHVPDEAKEFVRSVLNRLLACEREIDRTMKALDGCYVEPGPSGNPTRGDVDVLPTGKNFYSVDPRKVPTRRAWKVGKKLAENTIERYLEEHGHYPESVGIVLWASDVMRTGGEVLSQVMWLLGVRPEWDESGIVSGFEVVPLEELGRPRIDVVVRISGMFRDAFPNLVKFLNDVFETVKELDEPEGRNFVRKHTFDHHIFGDPPGAYGAGVNYAVHASAWDDRSDLADVYVRWGGYAYGSDVNGEEAFSEFRRALSTVRAVSVNQSSHEWDVLSCCCHFAFHGGMVVAAERHSGKRVECYHHDTTDPHRVITRSIEEELVRLVEQKLANDEWIESMLEHGARGVGEWLKRVENLFGWDATTGRVPNECYEKISEVLERYGPRFSDENPYAVEYARERLLEAKKRDLWR
ncbi:cobaltochelatase subunit CobN [Methanopyrus sp.]